RPLRRVDPVRDRRGAVFVRPGLEPRLLVWARLRVCLRDPDTPLPALGDRGSAHGAVGFVTSRPPGHHPRPYPLMAPRPHRAGLEVLAMGQPDRGEAGDAVDDEVPVKLLPRRPGRIARMLSGPLTMRRVLQERPALVHVTCLDLLPWAVLARLVGRVPVL